MYFYPFHVGDYVLATRHLILTEDLAYRRLLDLYYTDEKPLPLNIDKICKKTGLREFKTEVGVVLDEFFVKEADGYHNKRADEDITKYQEKANRALNANKKRWGKKSDKKSDPNQNQNHEPELKLEPKDKKLTPRARLSLLVASPSLVKDWFEHRNKKKAAVTDTVLDMIEKEAKLAGVPVSKAIEASIEYNWVGFKAKWYLEKNKKDEPTIDQKYKQTEWRRSEAGIINKGIELGIARTQWETMKAYRARLIKIIEDRNE